jgi:hypothetical protein
MNGPRAPVAGARIGIGLAVRALPASADRDRYYREFVAELYGLPVPIQLLHLAGLLSQAFALRAALGAAPALIEEKAMQSIPLYRRFRCRAMHRHYWHGYSTDDGSRYRACLVCHKDDAGPLGPNGAFYGPFAGAY